MLKQCNSGRTVYHEVTLYSVWKLMMMMHRLYTAHGVLTAISEGTCHQCMPNTYHHRWALLQCHVVCTYKLDGYPPSIYTCISCYWLLLKKAFGHLSEFHTRHNTTGRMFKVRRSSAVIVHIWVEIHASAPDHWISLIQEMESIPGLHRGKIRRTR